VINSTTHDSPALQLPGSFFKRGIESIETSLFFDQPILYNITMTIDEAPYL
jgi:hypothetical protein